MVQPAASLHCGLSAASQTHTFQSTAGATPAACRHARCLRPRRRKPSPPSHKSPEFCLSNARLTPRGFGRPTVLRRAFPNARARTTAAAPRQCPMGSRDARNAIPPATAPHSRSPPPASERPVNRKTLGFIIIISSEFSCGRTTRRVHIVSPRRATPLRREHPGSHSNNPRPRPKAGSGFFQQGEAGR